MLGVDPLAELAQRMSAHGVAFVLGAGVSVAAGVPAWAPLLDELIARSFGDRDQARLYSHALGGGPHIKARYLVERVGRERFVEDLRAVVYANAPVGRTTPVLASIARLCAGGRVHEVVTYNFDRLLEEALVHVRHRVIEPDTFPRGGELPLFHVHGWVGRERDEREWLVVTEDDFHEKYADPFDWANVVQLGAFSRRSCLFVGLSMEDPDLRRLLDAVSNGDAPHFALLPRTDPSSLAQGTDGEGVRAMCELADATRERVLEQLGVRTIWFDGFDELPAILERLR